MCRYPQRKQLVTVLATILGMTAQEADQARAALAKAEQGTVYSNML
jgi:hypothetical protein